MVNHLRTSRCTPLPRCTTNWGWGRLFAPTLSLRGHGRTVQQSWPVQRAGKKASPRARFWETRRGRRRVQGGGGVRSAGRGETRAAGRAGSGVPRTARSHRFTFGGRGIDVLRQRSERAKRWKCGGGGGWRWPPPGPGPQSPSEDRGGRHPDPHPAGPQVRGGAVIPAKGKGLTA